MPAIRSLFCYTSSTYIQLQYVGLDMYLRDPTLTKNRECTLNASAQAGSSAPSSGRTNTNQSDQFGGHCGDGPQRCEFTFFVPNGTSIDNFALTPYGSQIMNDPVRWRWLLRRLVIYGEIIYIDQIAAGASKSFYADNGEEIIVQTDSRSNIPSGQRIAYITFEGIRAQIIHSDIGATNGVIHIISSLLFVPEDLSRNISSTTSSTVDTSSPHNGKEDCTAVPLALICSLLTFIAFK